MRVLIVEDHAETQALVARALEREGHRVATAGSAAEATAVLDAREFDVIVLDLGLPDASGHALCAALRARGVTAPLLVLTAQGAVASRVACLNAGADDFLAKPFALAELRARVRALGRRGTLPRALVRRVGDVTLDVTARCATRSGAAVPLTAREWAVLELLALRSGRVVSRAEILEVVWDDDCGRHGASLDVMVARIRRKLGDAVVRTLRGEGYTLADEGAPS